MDNKVCLFFKETEGVCVCVLGRDEENDKGKQRNGRTTKISRKFPSFFTAESPFSAPYALQNEAEAANLIHSSFQFGLGSGILIAVPIPKVIPNFLSSPSFTYALLKYAHQK